MGSSILAPNVVLTKSASILDGSSAGFDAVGTLPYQAEVLANSIMQETENKT